jgi:hypothetical protein
VSCEHKRGYRTEKAARAELRKMRRTVVDWARLNAYYCEQHHRWHIGNRPFSGAARRVLWWGGQAYMLLALVGCADTNPVAPSSVPHAAPVTCARVDEQGRCLFTVKEPEHPAPLPEPCSTGTVPGLEQPQAECLPKH